jgi:SAM-dependent MidA family methyltransferase
MRALPKCFLAGTIIRPMAISDETENGDDSLAARLRARIEREGPISFREWMQAALYDEREGYYCRPDRVRQGRAGDYRTAPETSPLFAATFAGYFSKLFAELFFELGSPPAWTIVEAGAAGGEFAYGVLTTLRAKYTDVFLATSYIIDEASPATRRRAAERLAEFADRLSFQRIDEINHPAIAGVRFSNELIDAFPVHRVIMRNGRLRELCVGLRQNDFVWVERDPGQRVSEYCRRAELQLSEGQIAEINLEAEEFISRSAGSLDRGYLITVDYGAERNELLDSPERFAGTLRAFHRHQLIDNVLARPGEHDLTTTVDWTQLKEAGRRAGLRAVRLERLDQFLLSEGLGDLLSEMLAQTQDQVEALRLSLGAREMIMPHGLAASFQVLVQKKHS